MGKHVTNTKFLEEKFHDLLYGRSELKQTKDVKGILDILRNKNNILTQDQEESILGLEAQYQAAQLYHVIWVIMCEKKEQTIVAGIINGLADALKGTDQLNLENIIRNILNSDSYNKFISKL